MKLTDLGYSEVLEKYRTVQGLTGFETGRIVAEHKERYVVMTEKGELEAEITGNLRFSAKSREDFPAVGDWVSLAVFDPGFALIHGVLPRSSVISRKAAGRPGEVQVIAANIDYAFLVQAAGRDFNLNRLERYLTLCHASGVSPVIVLTKTDLVGAAETAEITGRISRRIRNVPVVAVSNETRDGYEALKALFRKGKTYCMLGSSGAGKSTLLNNLSGKAVMRTDSISNSTNKGKHVTSHRELTVLDNGGILIDNPGMREVGITDTSDGLETTFDLIFVLSENCRYKDCTHTAETGCAVIEAVEKGEIDRSAYENFLRLEREKAYFESSVAERRKKDKDFGKMVRQVKKSIRK